jgi:hypothetical protein
MIKQLITEDIDNNFIGFTVKYVKINELFFDTDKTNHTKLTVDPNKLFYNINDLLDYIIYEIGVDADIENSLHYYNFEQRGNMFVLTKKYSDALVEILFQPIVPKHTLSVYEYVHLCNGGKEI